MNGRLDIWWDNEKQAVMARTHRGLFLIPDDVVEASGSKVKAEEYNENLVYAIKEYVGNPDTKVIL